ncbi:DUF4249 domain-containing protein [Lacihabitans sp. LS3-19]|uniref:DUF4249 domain-containing protein n=1 Tax=Lacihabitans sp. LS3-19 TaxID=2487335 RepID=UPI0020CC676A|nr:DUF4249 domain-containing protein [Lacihabitans sp. LS3-19]MCP9767556.1 DUF4249 domain-containing protein [Lacihabitans sp. LS3-19]
MKNKFIFFALTILFFSCETIVDEVDLSQFPELREKIVVTSFIGPSNDGIIVRVSKSVPILGDVKIEYQTVYNENIQDSIVILKDTKVIEDAEVYLIEGRSKARLNYDKEKFYYTIPNLNIFPGLTYTLVVKALGQTVEASTTVPLNTVSINNFTIKNYFEITNSFFGKDTAQGYTINFDWKDFGNETNYYKVWGELRYDSEIPTGTKDSIVYKRRRGFGYLDLNNDFSGDSRYFNDEERNGGEIKITNARLLFSRSYSCFGDNFRSDCFPHRIILDSDKEFTIEVANITKELYDYQNSLRSFNQNSNNPFSEPSPVYSNIKNGLGIFASYNASQIKQKLN